MLTAAFFVHQVLALSVAAQSEGSAVDKWHPSLGNRTALHKNTAPGWVPEPHYRGTTSILYSSIITLILCVYSALHPNVPAYGEGRLVIYRRAVKWALIALIAPEVVMLSAYLQLYQAQKLVLNLNRIQSNKISTPTEQTISPPTAYENLQPSIQAVDFQGSTISLLEVATPQGGGEDLQLGSVEQLTPHISQPYTEYTFQPSAEYIFDLRYGFYAVMGGFALELDNEIREPEDSKRMAITTAGVLKLAEGGDFLMPDPETIADKSKADGIAKGLVIFQVTWMVIQVSARKLSGYPLTLLEVHTLVHALCGLMMYGIWFKKPTGVRDPTVMDSSLGRKLLDKTDLEWRSQLKLVSPRMVNYTGRDLNSTSTEQQWVLVLVTFIVCLAYGGVHAAAWNFEFPSELEQLLWRVSSVTIMAGSFAVSVWSCGLSDAFRPDVTTRSFIMERFRTLKYSRAVGDRKSNKLNFVYAMFIVTFLSIPIVVCARVAIVIESFISLRHVPEGAYVSVGWTNYIPHF